MLKDALIDQAVAYVQDPWLQKLRRQPRRTLQMVAARFFRRLPKPATWSIPVEAELFTGQRLHVVLPDDISTALYCYGWFEETLTRILLAYMKPGMVVLDVGAHVGYFSALALDLVGSTGQVHAFEPTPRTFALLKMNLADYANVVLNPVAVWSQRQVLTMQDYGIQWAGLNSFTQPRIRRGQVRPATEFEVEAVSIDDYVTDRGIVPDWVKIDAESAEFEILQGMQTTLQTMRPLVVLEVGDLGVEGVSESVALINELIAVGYWPYQWRAGSFERHTVQSRYESENLLFLPDQRVDPING